MARALGHPARIAVIRYLKQRGRSTVGDLVDHLGICQGTTSYHLNVLEEAKLLACQEDRPRMWYSVDLLRFQRLATLLKDL